VSLRKYRQCV